MEIALVQLAGMSPIPPDVGESGLQMEITMKYSPFMSLPATKVPMYTYSDVHCKDVLDNGISGGGALCWAPSRGVFTWKITADD